MSEFNVGDKVRVVTLEGDRKGKYIGTTGTVREVNVVPDNFVDVVLHTPIGYHENALLLESEIEKI